MTAVEKLFELLKSLPVDTEVKGMYRHLSDSDICLIYQVLAESIDKDFWKAWLTLHRKTVHHRYNNEIVFKNWLESELTLRRKGEKKSFLARG